MTIRRFAIEPLLPLLEQGFTLLAPNNRSVDGILREYANSAGRNGSASTAWQRPSVFAIDIYIQELWHRAASLGIAPFNDTLLLSRFDEQEIWLQIVKASFDEYPLLNSEETANSAARSYQFYKQWHVDQSTALKRYDNAVDLQTFLKWSQQFEARCKKHGVASLSDAGSLLSTHIDSLAPLLPEKIALVNFNQPPPLYAQLFTALSSVCKLDWGQSSTPDETLNEVFSGTETLERKFSGVQDEIAACLAWCRTKAAESASAHIGIVLDNNRSLEPLIEEALFREYATHDAADFDFSQHINRLRRREKLSELADFDSALAILSLNRELIDSERFCKILQSPYTIGAAKEHDSRLAFEVQFRRNGEAEIRLSHLRQLMLQDKRDHGCPILAAALLEFSEIARREPGYQPLRLWLQAFGRQLQSLGWPQAQTPAERVGLTRQWQQCTQRLAASSSLLGNISITTALDKLQTFLAQSNVDLRFDDRLQISLLDVEEAQDLVFDHLWMLSVDDRSWPLPINPVSFLPYSLQQELGMPASTHQQQLDVALSQLDMLRRQTRQEMVVSYHLLEDELRIRPSALLRLLPFAQTIDNTASIADTRADEETNEESSKEKALTPSRLERFEDSLHIPLLNEEEVRGGTTLLSNQSNCPFRAFARNRLNASTLEEFSQGLSPMVRGNALHKALENIGLKIGDSKTLHDLSSEQTDQLIADSATVAIAYLRRIHPETMTPTFSKIEQQRLSTLLQGFISLELQRSDFTILHNEAAVEWRHSRLSLQLRIDRIDRLQDGSLALIDYKTGKHMNYKWFDHRPDDMQLPLYQIAVNDTQDIPVSATLICQLNAENIGLFAPLQPDDFGAAVKASSQAKHFEGDWSALQAIWNKTIYSLIEEFEAGLLAVAPTRGHATCQYCDLAPLCRVAEQQAAAMMPSEDEL